MSSVPQERHRESKFLQKVWHKTSTRYNQSPTVSKSLKGSIVLVRIPLYSRKTAILAQNADSRRVQTDIRFPPPRCRRDSERIELPEWVRKWVSRHVALIQLLGPHSPLPTRRSSSSHRNTLPITSGPFFLARLPDHAAGCRGLASRGNAVRTEFSDWKCGLRDTDTSLGFRF